MHTRGVSYRFVPGLCSGGRSAAGDGTAVRESVIQRGHVQEDVYSRRSVALWAGDGDVRRPAARVDRGTVNGDVALRGRWSCVPR